MEENSQPKENEGYEGPFIVTWQNISNLTNKKPTACRNVIYELRKKHQRHHITVDDVCEYFMISKEQYYECQRKAYKNTMC